MAVYERAWRGYSGPLTPEWSRFLVIPRLVFQDVFASRIFGAFFTLCFGPPVVFAILIYLHHNVGALAALNLSAKDLIAVNQVFFLTFISLQSGLASLLALVVGPALISRDLANNALPLYLSRPLSRTEYLLGKIAVLVIMMSLVTWIPGLLLILLEACLEGFGWLLGNLRIPLAIFVVSWCWIAVLSLLNLAISAWVKRKSMARLLVIAYLLVGGGVATAVNEIFQTDWGGILDLGRAMSSISEALFESTAAPDLSVGKAWISLLTVCAVCLLLLARKVRAYEVVR